MFLTQDAIILNRAISFELRDVVSIPRHHALEDLGRIHAALEVEILGNMERSVLLFDDNDEFLGHLFKSVRFSDFRNPSLDDFIIQVNFVTADMLNNLGEEGGEIFPLCVREDFDLLPLELRDEIMYHANKAFALESR
jgi:hypothetical protein